MRELLGNEFLRHAGVIARYLRGGPQAVLFVLGLDEPDYMIVSAAADLAAEQEHEAVEKAKRK